MKSSRIAVAICAIAALIITIFGCGGGGAAFAPADKAAVYESSVAGHQSLQAGLNVGFVSLRQTAPSGSGLNMSTSLAQAFFNASKKKQKTLPDGRAVTLAYLPFLGLYFNNTTVANVQTINFFTDAAGTTSAGSLTITIVGASTFSTVYPSYPVTVQTVANVTGGKIPMNGNLSIVYQDSAGANTMQGQLNLPTTSVTVNIDMALSHSQAASGQVTVTTPDNTFVLNNVTGSPFATLSGNVSLQPQGWTGTGSITPLDALFTMNLNTPQGLAHAVLGADGKLVITYPDGTGNTVDDPSSASLEIPGGTTSTTATTATTTTSTTTTTAGTYADPVEFVKSSGTYDIVQVTGASHNGKVVGYEDTNTNSSRQPLMWTSPTSVTELQKPTSNASVTLHAVNASGATVGEYSSLTLSRQPIYYANAGATPITLKTPPNTSTSVANSMNDSGMIVGYYFNNLGKHACYWADKDADAVELPKGSIPGTQEAMFVDGTGAVYGISGNTWVKWDTASSNPVEMAAFTGSTQAFMVSVSHGGAAAGGYRNLTGNGSHPAFWASGSHSQTSVSFVTGFNDAVLEAIDGNGNGSGFQRSSSNVVTAWAKLGSTSRSLQDLVNNANGWTFYDAKYMDSSGNIACQAFKNSKSSWVYLQKN